MSDFEVTLVNECNMQEFYVILLGPKGSNITFLLTFFLAPYENSRWKIHVELPDGYPFKSPSIGFVNRIYHPNIDEV